MICTGTGLPSFFAGLKRQVLTVSTALFSKTGRSCARHAPARRARECRRQSASPPRRAAPYQRKIGYSGSGDFVAFGGIMPLTTRS